MSEFVKRKWLKKLLQMSEMSALKTPKRTTRENVDFWLLLLVIKTSLKSWNSGRISFNRTLSLVDLKFF